MSSPITDVVVGTNAEVSVLTIAMHNQELIQDMQAILKDGTFFSKPYNAFVWDVMIDMRRSGMTIDLITLGDTCLNIDDDFSSAGLAGIYNAYESSVNFEHHCNIIYSRFVQKNVNADARALADATGLGQRKDTIDLLYKVRYNVDEMIRMHPSKKKDLKIMAQSAKEDINNEDKLIKFKSSYLRKTVVGATRGEISVVGGRPSHGKTTFVVNILEELLEEGYKVIMVNREMRNEELLLKIGCKRAKLSYFKLRQNLLTEPEVELLQNAIDEFVDKFKENLIMFDDIREHKDTMVELERISGFDFIIDDYLQLIDERSEKENRNKIRVIINDYKWLTKAKLMHVMLVSQLSRDIEKRYDPRPIMSDLAESGFIEQAVETVIFLFRGYVFDSDNYKENEVEVLIAKARYGKIGKDTIGFAGDLCSFFPSPRLADEALMDLRSLETERNLKE